MNAVKTLQTILTLIISLAFFGTLAYAPLSTSSRWIVDAVSGRRVKLACVNWPGHMRPMVAEGLHKKPLEHIAGEVASMGFNCVRLTWATYMFTRANYTKLTVGDSLDRLGLKEARAGMARNNPWVLGLGVVEAQRAVVHELGKHNVMVVLDNHVSLPKWCCGDTDGNGFFGDEHFDPGEWLRGLTAVANMYNRRHTVVAMSIRNELRGPRQNTKDWYRYVQEAAKAIHGANPDVLVIVSGLSFDTNLSFLKKNPLALNLNSKLVYEAHWYPFGNPVDKWLYQTNEFCADSTQRFVDRLGFLESGPSPVPLFLSEFGMDQSGGNERDNRYFSCLLSFLAERDMDWALWSLQGSYMLREGQVEMEEVYGMLDADWDHPRDSKMKERLQLVQQMIQDPNSIKPSQHVMYHPQSGKCAQVNKDQIHLTDCRKANRWSHDGDGSPIMLAGTSRCLKVVGNGVPVTLSDDCSSQRSKWELVSGSKLHVAAKDDRGSYWCLDGSTSSSSAIVSKQCLCMSNIVKQGFKLIQYLEDAVPMCVDNPQIQWFKLIPTNRN